jgi:hypothetical protein
MGTSATGGALYTVAIGASSNAGHGGSICIGQSATSTAAHQLIIGSDKLSAAEITDVYIGKGVVDAAPTDTTYHATGGEGTNIAGADVTIAGGKGTGSGAGGEVVFSTSDAGSTGTTLQTLTPKMRILASGNVGINDSAPTAKLHVTVDDTEATECLELQQDDDSEAIIEFVSDVDDGGGGGGTATDYPISDFQNNYATEGSIQGMIRIKINGTVYWMPYYDDPS